MFDILRGPADLFQKSDVMIAKKSDSVTTINTSDTALSTLINMKHHTNINILVHELAYVCVCLCV